MTTKEKERKRPVTRGPSNNRAPSGNVRTRQPATATGRTAASAAKRSRKPEPAPVASDVVYLPAKPFQRNRLILQLAIVVAVVLAFILGFSVFFKVDATKTTVSGCEKYTAADIIQASGIQNGDHLLTFSRAQVAGKIISSLPYVDSVRIGIKIPDTVNIEIVEVKVPYAVKAQDASWWLISAAGKVIEKAPEGAEVGHTRILGVHLDAPQVGEQAVALETAQPGTDAEGNTVPITVTQAKRLQTALDIIECLEAKRILGKVASLDVNDLADIQLWYGQQYQVKLGGDTQLLYKISCMESVVAQMDSYQSGILDISFIIWPDKVGYTPFSSGETTILPNN